MPKLWAETSERMRNFRARKSLPGYSNSQLPINPPFGNEYGMTSLRKTKLFGLVLTILLAFGLVGVGFAHHVPGLNDSRLAVIAQLGGGLADLCDDAGQATPTKGAVADCPACHLVGAAMLPEAQVAQRRADLLLVAVVAGVFMAA